MGKKVILRKRLAENPKLQSLHQRAQGIKPVDAAHDFSHIERVAKLTLEIYEVECQGREQRSVTPMEQDLCIAAALLHDCIPVAKNSPLRKESSRLSSEQAKIWLTEIDFASVPEIDLVALAVLDHSYSSGRVPHTLLGQALQDADRLESLGALGLYRTIATGVSMGTELFDSLDPWAERRALDDQKFTLDHFYTKLFKLPATFQTAAAKIEAIKRADFLKSFAAQLKNELN